MRSFGILFLLPLLSLQDWMDTCETLPGTTVTPTKIPATGTKIKDMMARGDVVPRDAPFLFDRIVLVTVNLPNSHNKAALKVIKRSLATDAIINDRAKLTKGFEEGDLMSCQLDNEDVYLSKTVVALEDFCDSYNPDNVQFKSDVKDNKYSVVGGKLSGDLWRFPSYFKQLPTYASGSYGEVKLVPIEGADKIAVKKIRKGDMSLNEIRAMQNFSKNKFGVGFKGCFINGDDLYLAQDFLISCLNEKPFMDEWDKWGPVARVKFLVELVEAVLEFEKAGWVHNDLKAGNVMVDKNWQPHLIDYGLARKIGAPNDEEGTPEYMSPLRLTSKILRPTFDTYSLAAIIVAVVAKNGDRIWLYDPDSDSKLPLRDVVDPRIDPIKLGERIFSKYVVPRLGSIELRVTDPNKQNLSTLLARILLKLDEQITTQVLFDQLKRIYAEVVEEYKNII